jgi:hypothetical protein
MIWARMLAYITGTVDQELLLRNEYWAAENRILRAQIKGRLRLSEAEKGTLAEIAQRLGRKALEEVAAAAKPDTLLGWYRRLIAHNVLTALKRLALPAELLTARPKRLRFLIFNTPGRLVHHARRLLLRLAGVAQRIAAYREGLRLLPLPT